MGSIRKPRKDELQLIAFLIKRAKLSIPQNWRNELLVREMDDGNMGSLTLFPNASIINERTFGRCVSDFQFKDSDGVDVIASLNVDTNGDLFELDIWKMDYGELISLPSL